MAKLTIKITSTGEEFKIEHVDLTRLTPRQLIDEMISARLLPTSTHPFLIINKLNAIVEQGDLCLTLDRLGFVDGDIIKIINKPTGGDNYDNYP